MPGPGDAGQAQHGRCSMIGRKPRQTEAQNPRLCACGSWAQPHFRGSHPCTGGAEREDAWTCLAGRRQRGRTSAPNYPQPCSVVFLIQQKSLFLSSNEVNSFFNRHMLTSVRSLCSGSCDPSLRTKPPSACVSPRCVSLKGGVSKGNWRCHSLKKGTISPAGSNPGRPPGTERLAWLLFGIVGPGFRDRKAPR